MTIAHYHPTNEAGASLIVRRVVAKMIADGVTQRDFTAVRICLSAPDEKGWRQVEVTFLPDLMARAGA